MSSSVFRYLLFAVALVASLGLRIFIVDPAYRTQRRLQQESPRALRSPGPVILGLTSLEHRLALADIVWLDIVQALGQKDQTLWRHLDRQAEIATDLDPRYFTIYHSLGVVLAVWGKLVDASDRILKKGEAALPERWELPVLLGYNAYFIHGDAGAASEYMRRAAMQPGAPRFIGALAGRMRSHKGSVEEGIEEGIVFLDALIPTLSGPAKVDAEERRTLLVSERILRQYDNACMSFRLLNGSTRIPLPKELYLMRWTEDPPFDLFGSAIDLDMQCIAHTEMMTVREFEAKQRVGKDSKN